MNFKAHNLQKFLAILCMAGAAWCGGCSDAAPALSAGATPQLALTARGDAVGLRLPFEELSTGLGSGDAKVRAWSAHELGLAGGQVKASAPQLIQALHDSDPEVRYQAAWALGEMGPAASNAIPALTDATHDPSESVRAGSAMALLKLDPNSEAGHSALAAALQSYMHGAPAPEFSTVQPFGNDVNVPVRQLKNTQPKPLATPLAASGESEPAPKKLAASEMAGVKPTSGMPTTRPAEDTRVAVMVRALGDLDAANRRAAAQNLGNIGPAAISARTALVKLLSDPDPSVRRASQEALRKIVPEE